MRASYCKEEAVRALMQIYFIAFETSSEIIFTYFVCEHHIKRSSN